MIVKIELPPVNMALSPNSKNGIDGIASALGIDDRQFRPITIDGQYRKGDAGMIFEINIGDI